jgi:pullulanase
MGTVTTKPVSLATQTNSTKTPNFAYFSDTIRNALKGGTFGGISAGFISGGSTNELNGCFKGMPSWCTTPSQSINYISCHDNNTLYDHISIVKPNASFQEKADMNKLGVAFYMTAQGIPFMQAGEEILRSKPDASKPDGYNENSYNASDAVNSIKWDEMYDVTTLNVLEYYKGMIAFRKAHPALRMDNGTDVSANIFTLPNLEDKVLGYKINGGVEGESADAIVAIFNGNTDKKTVTLPEGEWHICVNKNEAGIYSLGKVSGSVEVDGVSALILVQGEVEAKPAAEDVASVSTNWIIVASVVAAVAILSAAVVILLLKKK